MDWSDLTPMVGTPSRLRAELAARGAWSGELDVLDMAVDELTRRLVAPRLAVIWAVDDDAPPAPKALAWGLDGTVFATHDGDGPRTIWYPR